MTQKKQLKTAVAALGTFQHISSSSVLPIKKFPAIVFDSTQPTVEGQGEDGDVAVVGLKFTVYVLVAIEKNETTETSIDAAEDELETLVDSVRTVCKARNWGFPRYTNELIDAVMIDERNCMMWMFDVAFWND